MTPFDIPPFNLSGVLPPFLSDPTNPALMSPFPTNLVKLVERFGTSPRRLQILWGLIGYRDELMRVGLSDGFQWLDGSFLENIEKEKNRPPGDIDLVTFARRPPILQNDDPGMDQFVQTNVHLFDPSETKMRFSCDAYFVDLDLPSEYVVDQTRYWFGLFSHRRQSFLWKGTLQIPLNDPQSDADAMALIKAKGHP